LSLLDDLKRRINFANSATAGQAKQAGRTTIGVSGESVIAGFNQEEARSDSLSVADYIKMRQNDGTVASLYNILTLPILANTYAIRADDKDSGEEQAEFVRGNLMEPPNKGGMDVPLSLFLADSLRAVIEGFRLFEKIYELRGGKIVYKRLATRDSQTLTLMRGDDGGYNGAKQRTMFQNRWVDVEIPAWKTFLFTYGKDKNYLYGESAFKAASYHYNIKHKLYYLSNLSVQVGAIPPQVIKGPADTSTTDRNTILNAFRKLGVKTTAYMPNDFEREQIDAAKGRIDPLPLIDHHNSEMARSILAQFLMLGTQSQSVGSWALSENQSDIFIIALKGLMQNLEDHINYYLVPDLIDLNFSTPAYPEFRFDDMTSDTKEIVRGAFEQLLKSGSIREALVRGIEEQMADRLEIDTEKIQKEIDKEVKENPQPEQQPIDPKTGQPAQPQPAKPVQQSAGGADRDPKDSPTRDGGDLSRRQRSESTLRKYRHDLIP
jgi:hypothetical protein